MAKASARRTANKAAAAKKAAPEQDESEQGKSTGRGQPHMDSGMQRQGDLNPQKGKDQVDTAKERNTRAGSEAPAGDHGFVGDLRDAPRFDEDKNPIDAQGRPRVLDPGEAPMDGVERQEYSVGKGGVHVRGRLYMEGETVSLSEEEANMIEDQGNHVTNADPVEAKAVAERRTERQTKRAEKRAGQHEEARKASRQEF